MGARVGLKYNNGLSKLAFKMHKFYARNPLEAFESFENVDTPSWNFPANSPPQASAPSNNFFQQAGSANFPNWTAAQLANPHWQFFATGSVPGTASGLAWMMYSKNYSPADIDYVYAWWMDGGPANAASTTSDTTLGIAMSPTLTKQIQAKYGDNWQSYFPSPTAAEGNPSLPSPTKQGNVPDTGFAYSASQVGKDIGTAVSGVEGLLGGILGGGQQPPSSPMPPPGPNVGTVIGFLILGVGIVLLIMGLTEGPEHIRGERKQAI